MRLADTVAKMHIFANKSLAQAFSILHCPGQGQTAKLAFA
jgi:hypothetical protein